MKLLPVSLTRQYKVPEYVHIEVSNANFIDMVSDALDSDVTMPPSLPLWFRVPIHIAVGARHAGLNVFTGDDMSWDDLMGDIGYQFYPHLYVSDSDSETTETPSVND